MNYRSWPFSEVADSPFLSHEPDPPTGRTRRQSECGLHLLSDPMETRRLRVGQPITPKQFEELSDEQLARLVPRAYREFFPGKDFCADGCFYLHDGTAWSFFKAGFLDE
ncbi:hypothetical protein [Piscinibacter sp.]|uniref:hypothetical protein n=1 Tax=Piscinibacter sp. TaxID=1903157 RepID=UPI002F41268E